jgi:5'-nucleotidase (lipoprotein e(P4) family)
MRRFVILSLVASVFACAPAVTVTNGAAPSPVASVPQPATTAYPRDLQWVRTAAEHNAMFLQTFKLAREKLSNAVQGRAAGTWAIITDADETLIDNSEYQRRLLPAGTFDEATWNAWVQERAAPALPGAVDYVTVVRALGGRVVVVTNREDEVCDETRDNLHAVGLLVDLVLCRRGVSDKNPRFESVQSGTAGGGLPPLEVVQWLGDNIQDFPRMTQSARAGGPAAFALFGERYFVLPNPMYGSFERNPLR